MMLNEYLDLSSICPLSIVWDSNVRACIGIISVLILAPAATSGQIKDDWLPWWPSDPCLRRPKLFWSVAIVCRGPCILNLSEELWVALAPCCELWIQKASSLPCLTNSYSSVLRHDKGTLLIVESPQACTYNPCWWQDWDKRNLIAYVTIP